MKQQVVTFGQLIRNEYLSKGFLLEDAYAIVRLATRISESSFRAAFSGTLVHGDTADRLCLWAMQTHRVVLDERSLTRAPTRKRKMWRGATAALAKAPANDNGGPEAVLRGLKLLIVGSVPLAEGRRRFHVLLDAGPEHEPAEVERALRSALGGGHG